MYVKSDKVILTDCDGALLDWEYAFDTWMHRHGYTIKVQNTYSMAEKYGLSKDDAKRLIMMFNESAWIRRLSPLRDAVKYVRKLHDEFGYVFHVITSLTDDEYSQHLRTKNLRELFGETVFERYVYLDCGAPKHDALSEYKDSECYWIEDKPDNAEVGIELGLRSILMSHGHNAGSVSHNSKIKEVDTWHDIYNIIMGY